MCVESWMNGGGGACMRVLIGRVGMGVGCE